MWTCAVCRGQYVQCASTCSRQWFINLLMSMQKMTKRWETGKHDVITVLDQLQCKIDQTGTLSPAGLKQSVTSLSQPVHSKDCFLHLPSAFHSGSEAQRQDGDSLLFWLWEVRVSRGGNSAGPDGDVMFWWRVVCATHKREIWKKQTNKQTKQRQLAAVGS